MSRRGSVSIQIGYHPMGIAVLAAPGVEAAGVPPAPQACGAVRPPAAVSVRYHVHTAHLPLGIALHQRELPESDMPRRPPRSPVTHTHSPMTATAPASAGGLTMVPFTPEPPWNRLRLKQLNGTFAWLLPVQSLLRALSQ